MDALVLDFLTNTAALPVLTAAQMVRGFVEAGVTTRERLFTLTDAELKAKCGVTNAAHRKKVMAAVRRGEAGSGLAPGAAKRSGGVDEGPQVKLECPQELPLCDIDTSSHVSVNRSPVMILWSAVVAHEVLGYSWEEALSLAHVVSALNAKSKAARIWNRETPKDEASFCVDGPLVQDIFLLGRQVPACRTAQGVRGYSDENAVDPRAANNRLKQAFAGPALSHVYSAMVCLARHEASAIRADSRRAYALYENFRPEIPDGAGGWGAAGLLSIAAILSRVAEVAVGGPCGQDAIKGGPHNAAALEGLKGEGGSGGDNLSEIQEGLSSRILKAVGAAGANGLSHAWIKKKIGAGVDVEDEIERMQMDGIVYLKDDHIYLL